MASCCVLSSPVGDKKAATGAGADFNPEFVSFYTKRGTNLWYYRLYLASYPGLPRLLLPTFYTASDESLGRPGYEVVFIHVAIYVFLLGRPVSLYFIPMNLHGPVRGLGLSVWSSLFYT